MVFHPDWVQYGFAGFAFALLCVFGTMVVWLTSRLLSVSVKMSEAVERNTAAIQRLTELVEGQGSILRELMARLNR